MVSFLVLISSCLIIVIHLQKLEDSLPSAFFDSVEICKEIFQWLPAALVIEIRRCHIGVRATAELNSIKPSRRS